MLKIKHSFILLVATGLSLFPVANYAQEEKPEIVNVKHIHAPQSLEEMPPLSEYEKKLMYSTDDRPAIIFFSGAYKKDNWTETTFTVTKRLKIFSENEISFSRIQFFLKPYEIAEEIKARLIFPDGSQKTMEFKEPDEIIVSYANTWGPQLLYTYTIPNLQAGVIVDYTYTIVTSLGSGLRFNYWYIQEMAYTIMSRYTIDSPRDFMPYKSSVENLALSLSPDTEIIDERKIVTYQFADIPAVHPEPLMPPPSQLFGRLIVDYQWPSSFTSEPRGYWRQVGRSQDQRVKRFVEDSITLEALADSITNFDDSPEDKIAKINKWIQENIQNLASLRGDKLLDGEELIHEPNSTVDELLDSGLGNNLEINKLTVGLMQAAGLQAYLSFAVSREKGVLRYNTLDTDQFDRSFVAIRLYGNQVLFSNPSAYDAPGEIIPWSLQGAIAMICTPGGAVFFKIPVEHQDRNVSQTSIEMKVDIKGGGKGLVRRTYSGQESIALRHAAFTLSPDMREGYVRLLLQQDFPEARIGKITFSGISTSEANIRISAEMFIPGYLEVKGRRMKIASELNILPFNRDTLSQSRKYPISFKYPHKKRIVEVIELPEGYILDHQPVNLKALSELGSTIDILRVRRDGYERERELNLKRIFFRPEETDTLKSFFKFVEIAKASITKASTD